MEASTNWLVEGKAGLGLVVLDTAPCSVTALCLFDLTGSVAGTTKHLSLEGDLQLM